MKHSETDLSKKPSFRCRRENRRTRRKPMEARLDWKPNAHKCRDQESNLGLISARRGKMHYTSLLLLFSNLKQEEKVYKVQKTHVCLYFLLEKQWDRLILDDIVYKSGHFFEILNLIMSANVCNYEIHTLCHKSWTKMTTIK